ncbi:MAG: flagellar hook-length control protein FliK [Acidimicrobiia bacterium]|nr:flagellar hook-length control protein FliK [Acidimicrobiia bacterium]
MIGGPRPLFPSRTESSGPEPSSPPPSPGSGDDVFGRTLTDLLRSDRADRPNLRDRRRSDPDDDRGPVTTARRDDRPEPDDDHRNQRVGDGDGSPTNKRAEERKPADGDAADNRVPAEGDAADNRVPADAERPIGTDRRQNSRVDAEAVDERIVATPQAVEVAVVTEFTPALHDLTVETADQDGTVEQITGTESAPTESAPTESAAAQPLAISEPVIADTTTADGNRGGPSVQADGTIDGDVVPKRTGIDGANNVDPAGFNGVPESDDGRAIGQPIDPSTFDGEPDVEPVDSGDDETDTRPPSNGAATAEVAAAESNIALATGVATAGHDPTAVPDTTTADSPASSSSSSGVLGTAGARTLDQPATAGPDTEADTANGDPSSSSPDTTSAVDQTETPGQRGAETAEQPAASGAERPPSGLIPAASHRAPATAPNRAATTTVDGSSPAPELVELQTTGLAERLRPAFAALRRGMNGLDELRLRIQDDNTGPIKVDIATIDNRVRVLLSAGNDDLMRQLGQERGRLADELRRAGFDQASIDIESNNPGNRRGHFEEEASRRPGAGASGPGPSGPAASGTIERASSRRHRGLTGLDLDL